MSEECLFNLRPKCFVEIDHSMIDNYGLLKLKKNIILSSIVQTIYKKTKSDWMALSLSL